MASCQPPAPGSNGHTLMQRLASHLTPHWRSASLVAAAALAVMLAACAAPWLARPTPTPPPTATAIPVPTPVVRAWPQVASPSYSIQVFMWWRPDLGERDLGLVQDMGFGWVKSRDQGSHQKRHPTYHSLYKWL